MNRNRICSLSGAALAALITAGLFDAATQKQAQRKLAPGLILSGTAALLTAVAITYLPQYRAERKLAREDLLTRRDIERIDRSIAELLGKG
ncbi:MAG: hypothetical protein E7666_06310 [Ruminococcaceae bacterium]|nr:hypothetical protein [Oscillospiraceae bacterium]